MTLDDIKLMVAGTKETKYMGEMAWGVPDGRCTTDFNRDVRAWAIFLGLEGYK